MRAIESSSLQNKRYLPTKREVTPKINHTKTTIAKSAPYLITKHHLDDSQMKRALHYDDENLNRNSIRRYSYIGEVLTCQNSKISTKINPCTSTTLNKPKLNNNQNEASDYYTKENTCEIKQKQLIREQIHKNHEIPYFTNGRTRNASSNTNKINQEQNYNAYEYKAAKKTLQLAKQFQEYGLQQMHAARKKMQKQAIKLRKLNQIKIQKDLNEIQKSKLIKLQNEIKNLRIKNLQLEKQKIVGQLQETMKEQQKSKQKKAISDVQALKINRVKLILNKPKYNCSTTYVEDTDSSFSSFELS